jgi:hypothetical protein
VPLIVALDPLGLKLNPAGNPELMLQVYGEVPPEAVQLAE